jgi:UDP-N-acetylglucosamine 2-epimerase (non-hydrolysing)
MSMKVMTMVGTRPEIIKLCRVIDELDRQVDHVLVHTGQNYDYELNEIFFRELGIRKADHFLNAAGKTAAETIGHVIAKADEVMEKEAPDAFLLLGDTNSCLAAISAKRRKIPVFHMEAGNRCFDERVPEEINRRIIDHISDINMPYTEHARRYLVREGIPTDRVIKTGSPMKEVLSYYLPKIRASNVLSRLELRKDDYFLVSAHREENVDSEENFVDLLDSLNALSEKYNRPVIVSTHPRTRQKLEAVQYSKAHPKISFMKPLGLLDYVHLEMNARCVISDSGTITEESSILGFPAVTIRQAHERPEGMDEGTLIMCGLKSERVMQSVEMVMSQHAEGKPPYKIVTDYNTENVSTKVARIIMSYTDYVNRVVWHK